MGFFSVGGVCTFVSNLIHNYIDGNGLINKKMQNLLLN